MSGVIDYVRESVLTAPDELELHALLPWARDEAPLPLSRRAALDAIVREWWSAHADACTLLEELVAVDRRASVFGACACARWTLERHWRSDDRRPWIAVETTEAWCKGDATTEQVITAAKAAEVATKTAINTAAHAASAAHAAAIYSISESYQQYVPQAAAHAANAEAYAVVNAGAKAGMWKLIETKARCTLCDVVRAAVECPLVEVWFASELQKPSA